jgi:hypothetical protein
MQRRIVLSVNDNPDYLFFTPITCWAWRKVGWEPLVFYHGKTEGDLYNLAFKDEQPVIVEPIESYRSDTITQISRLYASCVSDQFLMTGDIDMVPLSNYWNPDEDALTVYGHDLAGNHYPICYIGMSADKWKRVMDLQNGNYQAYIKRDLDTLPQARNSDFYKYWFCDQDLITAKVRRSDIPKTFINRGKLGNGYAQGRIDRGSWNINITPLIDCHMFQQVYHKNNVPKINVTMAMLNHVWPQEDFGWFVDYTNKYRELSGQS